VSIETAQALADAGGWTAFIALILFIGLALWKQWWVPGWAYRQEREDRQKADAQLDRNTKAIRDLTISHRANALREVADDKRRLGQRDDT
jgi:hypothetical protein